jgi:protein-disulfide isomerase
MRTRATPPLALAAALLAGAAALPACAGGDRPASGAHPAPPPAARAATLPAPATPAGHLPDVPIEGLSEAQVKVVADWAQETFCYCGCPHTVSECLRGHGGCHHAKRMARLAARLAEGGAKASDVARLVTDYYASFEARKRARLDVAAFGPPLGDPAAKVTLVEFSDFTCPYCQLFRPMLEKFAEERPGRVKLVFKPFPIESHPGALEAAQVAEWGREQDIFWPLHDRIFGAPHASLEAVGDWARELGKDPASLEPAMASGRLLEKVRASQAEARAAGLRGTPTLYFDGRRLAVPDLSEWMLEFTLQDEEEWLEHGGWSRD